MSLHLPEPAPRAPIRRTRLIQLIEEPHQAAVTVVVAGAGYGKTSLIADWASQAPPPVAWLQLDDADNNPDRLARRITAAIDETAVGDEPPPDGRVPATILGSRIGRVAPRCCLVIDDAHRLTDPAAIDLIDDLVADAPTGFRLIVAGRTRLPLRLGRLRVMDQVRDIDAADLRYTLDEVAEDFRAQGIEHLSEEEIRAIHESATGWPTGIHLTAIAIRTAHDQSVGGAVRDELLASYLDEYVDQEVLGPLPPDLRLFLEATAHLPYLTPELCNAALDRTDARRMLVSAQRLFPFLAPDREDPVRLTLNPMVGASLRRIAPVDACRAARAARHLLNAGDLESAGEIALESDDATLIGDVGQAVGNEYAIRSDFGSLARWLDRLPPEIVDARADLAYWRLHVELINGRIWSPAALRLDELAPRWRQGDHLACGRAVLCEGLRAFHRSDDQAAETWLVEALAVLPEEAFVERMHAATILGLTSLRQGDDERAAALETEAIACAARLPIDEGWSWQAIAPARGNAYALRGDVFSAITKYRMMLAELPAPLDRYEGLLRTRLVSLLIERAALDEAERELERIEQLLAVSIDPPQWRHEAMIARLRYLVATGHSAEAEERGASYVKHVRRLPEKNQLMLLLAGIWLERGDRAMVRSWLEDVPNYAYPAAQLFGDINYRELAATLLLAEERHAEAGELTGQLVEEAIAKRRWAEFVGLSMRRAVALHHLGESEAARQVARAAIERGVKGGFVRSFAVPRHDVTLLFADVWAESGATLRVKRRVQDLADQSGDPGGTLLTHRERELLRLVALGRSNQQVAADLFISVNTVRNHLVKISRRLHVRSRVEAVTRARELGLID